MNGNLMRSRSFSKGLTPAEMSATGRNRPRASARGGFTLIEVMVVIAIIAILATLVTLGVGQAMNFSRQVSVKMEMTQIELALANVAKDLNSVNFIPSLIILREDMNYGSTPVEQASEALLRQMFPGLPAANPGTAVVDWDGNSGNNISTILTAEQAYVFFLGGIPTPTDPLNSPAISGPTGFPPAPLVGKKRPPTYDFKINRLIKQANGFYVYIDGWEKSNAYIVYNNISKSAGYTNDDAPSNRTAAAWGTLASGGPFISICPVRFLKSASQLQNPKGYQIFSAGKNGVFGGSLGGSPFYQEPSLGVDDQANFAESLLGKPID